MARPDTSSPHTDPYRVRFLVLTDPYAEALERNGYIRNLNEGILRKKGPSCPWPLVQGDEGPIVDLKVEPQSRGVLPMHAGHPRAGKRNQAYYERDMES